MGEGQERGRQGEGGEAARLFKGEAETGTVSFLLHYFHQSKSQVRARFKGTESRLYLLMAESGKEFLVVLNPPQRGQPHQCEESQDRAQVLMET